MKRSIHYRRLVGLLAEAQYHYQVWMWADRTAWSSLLGSILGEVVERPAGRSIVCWSSFSVVGLPRRAPATFPSTSAQPRACCVHPAVRPKDVDVRVTTPTRCAIQQMRSPVALLPQPW